ncbi:hypothetical protein BaRGS_00013084 [Batillaria attramentaria]|uniref:EGF-like domain-containing protein n=1 Tax=Batillaria attramentaria TaxID=370345 RepID=A0ABD0L8F1_9CAEN
MVTRRSSMLLTAVILYVAARASAQDDYDAAPYRDGSCSLNAYDDCVSDALCKSNPDHTRFMCYCPDGFDGDGFSDAAGGTGCRPTNGIATCTAESDCFNAFQTTNVFCEFSDDGLNGVCKCNEGFTFNLEDYTCYDVDECLNNMCSMNAKCENFPGSYSCTCEGNYVGDGTVCTWRCYTHGDCNANSKCRNDGSCKCDAGFSSADGTNRDCADIDECANGELTCPDKADCVNTAGSAHCECQDGFYLADNQCKPYDKTCNAMYSADMTSGVYTIDPDGEGPKPPVDVYCEVRDGFAITVVGPRDTSPEKMPKSGGTSNINYGNVDPQDLLDNSPFCSQEIWVECTKNLVGSVSWTDVSGNTYTSWPSQSNECPCGQMNQCDTCNCGAGAAGLDQGYIINMAVSSVTFPSSNRAPGTYLVGPLRCGPEPFGEETV